MKKGRLVLLCLAPVSLWASQPEIGDRTPEGCLSRGLRMYETENFSACIDRLEDLKRQPVSGTLLEEADFYIALSKYRMGDSGCVDVLERFAADYPASLRRFEAWFHAGNFCFFHDDYGNAARFYSRIPDNALAGRAAADLIYRKAFTALSRKDYVKARQGFAKLKGDRKYNDASVFYNAYILYAERSYAEAEAEFKRVPSRGELGEKAQYYICQIRFQDGDYDKVVAMGSKLLAAEFPAAMEAELRRILGESEYHLGNSARSVKLLTEYEHLCEGRPERSALYILGVATFREGDNSRAVERLDAVVGEEDAMAQSAYLYIGQAYLREENMNAASMAFEKAYKMDFDRDVQETAFYNYAIAQSQGGRVPFANSVRIFEDFLNRFPDSEYAPNVEDYIISSYLANKDYDNALSTISSLERPSNKILGAKQNILYRLGVRELSGGDASAAMNYFAKASQLSSYDRQIARETELWMGEASYRSGDYAKAKTCFSGYLKTAGRGEENRAAALYGLGYACFQMRDYAAAQTAFQKLLKEPDLREGMQGDAYSRIADCRYYARDYASAELFYKNAAEHSAACADYVEYQQGMMAGLQNRHAEKIGIMDKLAARYPQSVYAPKALYEKAQAYVSLNRNGEAETVFSALMNRYPQSVEARQGQLQLAMLFSTVGKRKEAIEEYRELIRKFPSSEEAKVAVEDLKTIYAEDGRLDEFSRFMKETDASYRLDENEMERLTFESAENDYIDGKGVSRLKSYISTYVGGEFIGQAEFYIAEDAYAANRTEDALSHVEKALAASPDASYAETALMMQGELLQQAGKPDQAEAAYRKLLEKASASGSRQAAELGLMRIARDRGDDSEVKKYADSLLKAGGMDKEKEVETVYSRAEARMNTGETQQAVEDYESLASDMNTLYGSIAAVALAEHYCGSGEYAAAEKTLSALIDSGTTHHYWLARGFILLSDVYQKRGDSFQAREYLESLKANYPGKEADIFEMIESRLKALKK